LVKIEAQVLHKASVLHSYLNTLEFMIL